MTQHETDRAVACEAFNAPEIGEGLRTVKLAGWGSVESTHGTFIVDETAAQETIAAFDRHGTDVPIDIEHSVLNEKLSPEQRGAIGWITKVFQEAGRGLFALVKWSDKGKELIRSAAFKYLSPVFLIRKDDRRVVGLHSAAVTTKPALVKAELLAASQNAGTEAEADPMTIIDGIAGFLGIKVEGDVTAMLTAIREKVKAMVKAAASAEIASSARPVALSAAEVEIAKLKDEIATRDVDAMIREHGRGKLNPNAKEVMRVFRELARTDPDRFVQACRELPVQVEEGRTTPPSKRQLEIGRAEREYRGNVGHQRATSLKAFTSQWLRDKGHAALTEDEAVTLNVG